MDNIQSVAARAEHRFRVARDRYNSIDLSNSNLKFAHTRAIINLTWVRRNTPFGSLNPQSQYNITTAQTEVAQAEERVIRGLEVVNLAMVDLDVAEHTWLVADLVLAVHGPQTNTAGRVPSRTALGGDEFIRAWSEHVDLSRAVIDTPLPKSSARRPPPRSVAKPAPAAQAPQSKPQPPPLPPRRSAARSPFLPPIQPEDPSLPSIATIAKYFEDVRLAFADYSNMQTFPPPPSWQCGKPSCRQSKASRSLEACECNIRYVFNHREDLKAERLRFHPDRFAKCPEPVKTHIQKMAKEIFVVVDRMSRGQSST